MITDIFSVRLAVALGVALAVNGSLATHGHAQQAKQQADKAGAAATTTAPVLSAEAGALKASLDRRFGTNSLETQGYAAQGYKPIWTTADGGLSDEGKILVEVLADAADHALPAAKYGAATLAGRAASAGSDRAGYEADLTRAYLTYAKDVSTGLLEPRSVDREIYVFPEAADPRDLIAGAARATNMAAYLDGLAPGDPIYRRLVERYAAFRTMAATEIWGPAVAEGRTMRPGERSKRIAQARARLTAMGDLDPNVYDLPSANAKAADGTKVAAADFKTDVPVLAFEPTLFDDHMVTALQSFQARHGLNLDGVIGPATLAQINVSPGTRAEQIAVNLERLRWMNRDLGNRHILVNLAGFTMDVMVNGKSDFSQRVVVGKARKHRTPEFSDEMTHMIVNPSWYVPTSIAQNEILPKLDEDPDYLAKKNMRMVNGRIIQAPGRGNALGTVKFMFPNRFAIYLHDTPSKRLFNRDVRAFSHGCVRVQRPHDFAEYLLTGQYDDPRGYFESVLNRGRERRITLDNPLPVHLTYRSAWIDENGIEQFRGDVYARDARIAAALKNAGVSIVR